MSTAKVNWIPSVDVTVVQLGGFVLVSWVLMITSEPTIDSKVGSRPQVGNMKQFFSISGVYEAYQDDPRQNEGFIHVFPPQHLHGQILNCDKTNCMKCPSTSARDWPLSAIQWISLSGGSLDSDFVSEYLGKSVCALISTIKFTETPFLLLTNTSRFISK